jgi:hypothetical protein
MNDLYPIHPADTSAAILISTVCNVVFVTVGKSLKILGSQDKYFSPRSHSHRILDAQAPQECLSYAFRFIFNNKVLFSAESLDLLIKTQCCQTLRVTVTVIATPTVAQALYASVLCT